MLGFDALGKLSLGGLPLAAPTFPVLGVWSYYDWSAKPGPLPRTGPEINVWLNNRLPALLTQPALQTFFLPLDFYRHPPAPPHGPAVPELLANRLPGLLTQPALNPAFVPFDFYRHPPPPPPSAKFDIPNLLTMTLSAPALKFNFMPIEFIVNYRHPPPYVRGSEFIFPNIELELLSGISNSAPVVLPPFVRKAQYVLTQVRRLGYTLTK